jgi:hypothetical protein
LGKCPPEKLLPPSSKEWGVSGEFCRQKLQTDVLHDPGGVVGGEKVGVGGHTCLDYQVCTQLYAQIPKPAPLMV